MLPVQVNIRNTSDSPVLIQQIQKNAEKLTRYYKRITHCRVVIDYDQKHQHRGKIFNVKVELDIPGRELMVTRKKGEDVYVVARQAFEVMRRQLEELARKRHGRTKTHAEVIFGHVTRLMPHDGYGFIESVDGQEFYFSLTNVAFPSFDQLQVGDGVYFSPGEIGDGSQAQHISRTKSHRAA